MLILVLGKNGQVGWELQRSLAPLGDIIALDSRSSKFCGDLSKLNELRHTLSQLKPDVIVNAAAYTAVDKAETDEAHANLINSQAVAVIAQVASELNALFVHYSTDYVYPGTGTEAWQEDDITAPLNIYGKTKRNGEEAIERLCSRYLIFRTSWVYASKGNNFAKTMLKLAREKESLSIINDQMGAPTGAELIADTTAHAIRTALAKPGISGIYHLTAAGTTSWLEYAQFVFDVARKLGVELTLKSVKPVTTDAYPTSAARPLNSRLSLAKLEETFGLQMPHWKNGVERVLDEWLIN